MQSNIQGNSNMFKLGEHSKFFTAVNVFPLTASDFGVSFIETSNSCESACAEGQCLPTFTTQDN
jgi:hypothetical protein